MRYILIMMTLLCSLVGCSKDPLDDITPPQRDGESAVTFGVVSNEIETQTRGTVLLGVYESKLHNYNIFCYHKTTGEEQHFYSSSDVASTLILDNGDWEVYVFANTTTDMGDMTREEVENYTYTITKTTDLTTGYKLVMVHHSTISVGGDTSINLEVERLVARFDIDIEFSGDAAGYKIVRTEVINEAATCKVFGDNPPANRVTPTYTSGIYGSMTFYVLENLQGVVSSITRPQDKNIHNAPPAATHIKIYVESATHEIVYTYYLGGNTINDFDIERNTRYEIAININGMNPEDMRVESTKIPVIEPDPVYEIYGDYSKFVTIDTFHEADGWTLSFESDGEQTIDLDFIANYDNSNEVNMPYLGILIEESHYQGGAMQIEEFSELMEHNILHQIGETESYYLINCSDDPNISATTQLKATVKSGVKYRLILGRWNWTNDYSSNDIRLYMNRGTANERYVDLKFETTLDADVVLGSDYSWKISFDIEGKEYVDVEFVASASTEVTPYYGFLMTELHYLTYGDRWAENNFFGVTPLRAYNYPDAPAILLSDNIDEQFPNDYAFATNHARARLECGVVYRFMVTNTQNPYDNIARQCITVYTDRGTADEKKYYLTFQTKGS